MESGESPGESVTVKLPIGGDKSDTWQNGSRFCQNQNAAIRMLRRGHWPRRFFRRTPSAAAAEHYFKGAPEIDGGVLRGADVSPSSVSALFASRDSAGTAEMAEIS